jgi:hypothetical protein
MKPEALRELFAEACEHCYIGMACTQGKPYPEHPAPYDINCGFCEEWAVYVCERLPGARVVWLDELTLNRNVSDHGDVLIAHCVIRYRGRLYDAETFAGVRFWYQVPVYKNRNRKKGANEYGNV